MSGEESVGRVWARGERVAFVGEEDAVRATLWLMAWFGGTHPCVCVDHNKRSST
jgi:hypothetical protein